MYHLARTLVWRCGLEFNNNSPIYIQIIGIIKKRIIKGNLKLGDKLPSTRDLAIELKVNPNTIARVYKELELENITFTKRGMGTFITEDIEVINSIKEEMANNLLKEFYDGMLDLGINKENMIAMLMNLGGNDNVKNNES